jgi:hypothetical protein
MNQIRTKKAVVIDPINMTLAVVYLKIVNVVYSLEGNDYSATGVYSVREEVGEGDDVTTSERVIFTTSTKFSAAEANQLEIALNVQGTTVSQRLVDIIPKLTMYQAGTSGIFGLAPEDFEFYVPE